MKEQKLSKRVTEELSAASVDSKDLLCTAPFDLSTDCEYISGTMFLTADRLGFLSIRLPKEHVWHFRGTKTQHFIAEDEEGEAELCFYDLKKLSHIHLLK